ncbi:MAG: zinc ribbon domain-containing protein [Candidatus Omnitrophota bacterium]
MPIYEYLCLKCKARFDFLVRGNAEKVFCPECGSEQLEKLVSSFAFNSRDAGGSITASSSSRCAGCSGRNCSSCSG